MRNNIEKNHLARVTYEKTLRASPNKKKRQSRYHTSLPRIGKGDRVIGARVLSYAEQMRLSFSCTTNCLSCHSHPIRPCGAPSPRGEDAIRDYHPQNRRQSRPFESIRSPSTVIPSEAEGSLLHCRHMHTCALTQTTPWRFLFRLSLAHDLPLCKKYPSTSALMTRKKDGSSHIVFHTAA